MSLSAVRHDIITCNKCARLRSYCAEIARVKRAAFRNDTYWAKPVPGFGDPNARMLILGLAPAAHGGNRTGRVFTGDGGGGSGDFLMAALHLHGFASIPTSQSLNDGLTLNDAYIAAAVRCAPPDNKPTPEEFHACRPHLHAELQHLPNIKVVVALGKLAFDAWWTVMREKGVVPKPRPEFGHGVVCRVPGSPIVIGSYHPSRQNTNTGKLTAPMMSAIFKKAATLIRTPRIRT